MEGISKRFPGVVALDDVSLAVGTGEIVALIGENRAGKSTLMKILGGAISRDTGTIRLHGQPVEIRSPREASALGIEFIHQELSVLDNLDVAANIFLRREPTTGGLLKLIDRKRVYRESDQILRQVGLDIPSRTPLSQLSIAQQQLVEIARALSAGARIIIMDEPTSSLTLTETRRLLELVKDLRAENVSIIYISHRMHEVKEIADRAVVLRDGKNAGEIQRDEITHERMVRMMVGRDLKDFFKGAHFDRQIDRDGGFEVRRLRTLRFPNHRVAFNVAKGEVLGLAGLIVDFNVRENITLPNLESYSSGKLINRAKETRAAREACKAINIKTPTPEMRAANLSGGNQQKVVLAKWLTFSPRVLIFDEPTRGIDVGAKAEIYELIRKLAADGVSVIVISSEMEEVLGISDRIAVMHEGRLTGILDRADFSEEAVMRLATGTQEV